MRDGAALYEHTDPRRGERREWGTLVFNDGRNQVRPDYQIGVPERGRCRELLNSASEFYGGSHGQSARPLHGFDYSVSLVVPPLGFVMLKT